MINASILLNATARAFPQEWAALVEVLEYLYDTMPQGVHGLSAHDMTCGYAIASSVDRRLAPFMVPKGLPETEVCAKLFPSWKELYGCFSATTRRRALK